MDQLWEIVGIIVAVVMVVIGLRLILKKPKVQADDTPSEVLIEAQSQQPVTPRHLRDSHPNIDTTQSQNHAERKKSLEQVFDAENTENSAQTKQAVEADGFELDGEKSQAEIASPSSAVRANTQQDLFSADPDEVEAHSTAQTEKPLNVEINTSETTQTKVINHVPTTDQSVETDKADEIERFIEQLDQDEVKQSQQKENDENEFIEDNADTDTTSDNQLETVKIEEWQGESDVLDAHLSEQYRNDEESALAKAEQLIALYLYPNPTRALSGDRALKTLLKYGLRFGEMSCFHRYENPETVSPLMFSVLRINDDGAPTGFDLETLPSEEVKGLAFFLALPNSHAVQGFDMMVSLAGLMARDIDGLVFDEQSLELTPQLRDHWRHYVIEYKSSK